MPIQFVAGDLFDNDYEAEALAHGCNCQGSMGAGVAKTFRARYPEMYEEYRGRCKAEPRAFNLGDCWLWRSDRRPWVFNLGTQEGYWRSRASYEAIEAALLKMREQADAETIAVVAMPRIGVGYGGLSWKKVRAIVERVFEGWSSTLVVFEEYVPREPGDPPQSDQSRVAEPERSSGMNVIQFYRVSGDYGYFSNFSPHPVKLKGKTWPTSEHYFQAQKFAGAPDEEEVRLAKSPMNAARMGRSRNRPLRKDWESAKDAIMHEAVLAKFTQHDELRESLLSTGDAEIVEHTKKDRYWGDGGDGRGKNMLGKILMWVRAELRDQRTEV
jgi:ribA/ribD-fused uncharacterized protein